MKRPCSNCGKGNLELKKCAGCGVATYCSSECQHADWKQHKRYCKHLVAYKMKELAVVCAEGMAPDVEGSEVYGRALTAAQAKGEEAMVFMTPIAAQRFMQALHDDVLPSCETEEKLWGLWGDPRSDGYVNLLRAYQQAGKFGDLTATKLMEALCARPHASKALTQLLRNTKFIVTEDDYLDVIYNGLDRYLQQTADLEVNSELDKWPINTGGQAAAAGALAAAAAASGSQAGSKGSGGNKS